MGKLLVHNVGMVDRAVRVILGIGLLTLAFAGPRSAWGYLGIVPLATALLGTCPFYTLLGFSTCSLAPRRAGH